MTCDANRPCSRCIKRNIGHLCHDEPRDSDRKPKIEHKQQSGPDENTAQKNDLPTGSGIQGVIDQDGSTGPILQDSSMGLRPTTDISDSASLPQNSNGSVNQNQSLEGTTQNSLGRYNDWSGGTGKQFQDIHTFHPSYMFNAPETTNEYNLLNDFLSTSLLDDAVGNMYGGDDLSGFYSDPSLINSMGMSLGNAGGLPFQPDQTGGSSSAAARGVELSRPPSTAPNERSDKARETYYMTAADPSGTDPPEERMNKLLKAKYDAGLLKPFNYVKGYARLQQYMEKHMRPASKQKILKQLDKFRPMFRERMQSLTDIELVLVEMWFERSLMEYDRIFASMAIPACCWRRTGEIFRGNKEMAELIHVPIEMLRDGKLAIHEIVVEDQLVSYWEKFGAIAFDNKQKAMLTSCTLRNPDRKSSALIECCFSFTIRRDNHDIPSLIVGNFLPA